jgi:hypothetical protein
VITSERAGGYPADTSTTEQGFRLGGQPESRKKAKIDDGEGAFGDEVIATAVNRQLLNLDYASERDCRFLTRFGLLLTI